MADHKCNECPIRAKYGANPKSLVGRFWRWHIGFCPGWKAYYSSLSESERAELKAKYNLKK